MKAKVLDFSREREISLLAQGLRDSPFWTQPRIHLVRQGLQLLPEESSPTVGCRPGTTRTPDRLTSRMHARGNQG
jgi:hypothetical protein